MDLVTYHPIDRLLNLHVNLEFNHYVQHIYSTLTSSITLLLGVNMKLIINKISTVSDRFNQFMDAIITKYVSLFDVVLDRFKQFMDARITKCTDYFSVVLGSNTPTESKGKNPENNSNANIGYSISNSNNNNNGDDNNGNNNNNGKDNNNRDDYFRELLLEFKALIYDMRLVAILLLYVRRQVITLRNTPNHCRSRNVSRYGSGNRVVTLTHLMNYIMNHPTEFCPQARARLDSLLTPQALARIRTVKTPTTRIKANRADIRNLFSMNDRFESLVREI